MEDAEWFEGIFHSLVAAKLDAYHYADSQGFQAEIDQAMDRIDSATLAKVTKSVVLLLKGVKPTPPIVKQLRVVLKAKGGGG